MPRGCCRICRNSSRATGSRRSARRCARARATARAASARSCRAAPGAAAAAGSSPGSRAARARTGPRRQRLEQLAARLEALVQRRAAAASASGSRRASEVLQQDGVELRHRLGGAVVALHQLLAGAPRRRCREAASARRARSGSRTRGGPRAGRRGSAGGCAGPAASASWRASCARLRRAAIRPRALPARPPAASPKPQRARDPQDHLQVAQPAGRLLEVGLQGVGGVLVLGVALLLLERLRLEERPGRRAPRCSSLSRGSRKALRLPAR